MSASSDGDWYSSSVLPQDLGEDLPHMVSHKKVLKTKNLLKAVCDIDELTVVEESLYK